MGSCVRLIVVMSARARVHVRVANVVATTDISAKPIRQNLLVLGQNICLVGARAGHIDTTGLNIGLVAKSEFRNLSNTVLGVSLVLEVEITQDLVAVWCRSLHESTFFVLSQRLVKSHTLLKARAIWCICLRTNGALNGCFRFPLQELLSARRP